MAPRTKRFVAVEKPGMRMTTSAQQQPKHPFGGVGVNQTTMSVFIGIIMLVVVGGIVYDVYARSIPQPTESVAKIQTLMQTNYPLNILKHSMCNALGSCTSTLSLIHQTKDIMNKHRDETAMYESLDAYRAILRNPITNDYVFVDKRYPLDRQSDRGGGNDNQKQKAYRYQTFFSDKQYESVPVDIKGKLLKQQNPNIDLYKQIHDSFAYTTVDIPDDNHLAVAKQAKQSKTLKRTRYIIQEYPWRDSLTNENITKRSLLYRYDENTIIGSGFTLTELSIKPDQVLVYTCLCIYMLFLLFAFVYPGIFLRRTIVELSSRPLLTVIYIIAFVGMYLYVVVQHCRSIQKHDNTERTHIISFLHDKRYIAITLAGLAVALGFFATHQQQESDNIMPALFAGLVFSLAAMLDFFLGNTNEAYKTSIHFCNTFITCSVTALVWLFSLLFLKYSLYKTA